MHSVIGMLVIVAFAYAVSSNRTQIAWRTVTVAFFIQFAIGGVALFTSWGNKALSAAADATGALILCLGSWQPTTGPLVLFLP